MFEFIKKKEIWDACDKGYLDELKSKNISYQLKHAQDLAIYRIIRGYHGLDIAEIGGGNSRILERLARVNRCVNIEKFEGRNFGPNSIVNLEKVINVSAYIGDFDEKLNSESFDILFSISVVEHIENENLDNFFRDSLRVLRPGGKFIHAIDLYIKDEPTQYQIDRFEKYRQWVLGSSIVKPLGKIYEGIPKFSTDMISNPDNILYG